MKSKNAHILHLLYIKIAFFLVVSIVCLTHTRALFAEEDSNPKDRLNACVQNIRELLNGSIISVKDMRGNVGTFVLDENRLFYTYENIKKGSHVETKSNDEEYLTIFYDFDSDNNEPHINLLESYYDLDYVNCHGLCIKQVGEVPFLGFLPTVSADINKCFFPELVESVNFIQDKTDDSQSENLYSGNINGTKIVVEILPQRSYAIKKLSVTKEKAVPGEYSDWLYEVDEFMRGDYESVPKKYHINIRIQSGTPTPDPAVANNPEYHAVEARLPYEVLDYKKMETIPEEFMEFSVSIPNNTPVTMPDASQIAFVWMDGKIVPKTDEVMLKIAQSGHKFIPGPKEPRFWLILLGIIAVLASGGWKLYTFWTSGDESTPSLRKEK